MSLIARPSRKAPSLPARGVWIEICRRHVVATRRWSLPARGVWIEIGYVSERMSGKRSSLPARGVWIEIMSTNTSAGSPSVAPRKGSVD